MDKTVYLIPAPDMDERTINSIQVDGCKTIPLLLDPISEKTQMQTYIKSLVRQIHHDTPVLLGTCYGGPLAVEISKILKTEKVIIVAGLKCRSELSLRSKFLFHCYLFLPLWLEKAFGVTLSFTINKLLKMPIKIPRLWRKGSQNRFIAKHLLGLEGNEMGVSYVRIHGKHDSVFPMKTLKNVDIVIDAGHFMLDKKRKVTLSAISKAVHDL